MTVVPMRGNYGLDHYCPDHGEPWASCGCDQSAPAVIPEESRLDRLRAQLVDTGGLDSIVEPDPLITGVLYRDALAWIYGAPGSTKSFIAIDIAGCVATGQSWQGFGHTGPGNVLYLVAEGVSGIRQRVRAWEQAAGQKMIGVRFLPVAVQAALAGDWDVFVDLATEIKPTLIVIDTQARVTSGMEENSAKEMGEFVRRVDQLRLATGACVLVVHHTGRGGEHMRGSIAMDGAATTVIKVVKSDTDVTVKCDKQKDAEPFDDLHLRMIPTANSVVLAVTDSRGTPGTAGLTWLVKWWASFRDDPVSVATLDSSEIVSKTTFHRNKFALLDRGVITRSGDGNATRYRLIAEP